MHTKKTKPGRPAKNLLDFQKVTLKIGIYCLVRMVLVFRLKRTTTWNDLQYREAIDVNGRQQPVRPPKATNSLCHFYFSLENN